MENSNVKSKNLERGCLFTTLLKLSYAGAFFVSFFCVGYLIVNFPDRLGEVEYWVLLFLAVISIYGIYAIYKTLKMEKKYAYRLLVIMGFTIFLLIYGAFNPRPVTDEQKAGAGLMLIFAMICLVSAITVACNLTKMESKRDFIEVS